VADSVARQTLDTARFYLAQARVAGASDRLLFVRHLQTAVIYARSVTFHLQTEYAHTGFKAWWAQQEQALRSDRRARFFLETRNFALKEGPLAIRQVTSIVVGGGGLVFSGAATVRMVRGAPWYKRSPRIIWQDTRRAVLGPLRGWQDRRAEARRIREAHERAAREDGTSVTHELYFLDREWSATPASVLVSEHLDILNTIVGAAETKFGAPSTQECDQLG
jgi:hypothetical protein